MQLEQKTDLLNASAGFRGVSEDVLRQVLEGSHCKSVKRGEHFFLEGQAVTSVYVLVSGVARTYSQTRQAREFTVEVHSA